MPPKNKNLSPWQACEKCGVILTTKDLQIHLDNSCAAEKDGTLLHGQIKDGMLMHTVEEFNVEESGKSVPSSESSHCVFLSESAMQLCELVIGGHALIKYPGGSAVRTAWPMYQRTLTSILLTRDGLDLLHVKAGTRVSVGSLSTCPIPAAVVVVEPVSPTGRKDISDAILANLSKKFLGKVLMEGNKLYIRHFGQKIHFIISRCFSVDCKSMSDGSLDNNAEVIEGIKKLSVSKSSKNVPYSIFIGTKFKLPKLKAKNKRTPSLASVGGLNDVITKLKEFLEMAWNPLYSNSGVVHGRGCLIYGSSGTGKTLLIKALAAEYPVTFIEILGSEVYSKYVGEAEARLRSYFYSAKERSPSLIFIDEIDALCPHNPDGTSSNHLQEKRITATLLSLLDALKDEDQDDSPNGGTSSVLVIGATSRITSLDSRLRRPGRLDLELEVPIPGPSQRLDILQRITGQWDEGIVLTDQSILEQVAAVTHGHVGADLASVCSHAVSSALKRLQNGGSGGKLTVREEDFNIACVQVKPSAMREVMVEVPNVRWTDIGGQHELKLKLKQAVEWPLRHPEAFKRLGISPPKGLLMFGPPGCSKTMIAKALATESGLNFISIKGPELFSKWVGESERAVREVFHRARQVSPSVVFFDELDALGGERGGGGGGSTVQERVLAQLLTEMDGITPLSQVTIVAATNRPDRIDKALLRPGRLDQIVYVPLPDADTRRDILTMQFKKSRFSEEVSLDEIIERTEGYSGAEVLAVCYEAGLNALEEDIGSECIKQHHVGKALRNVKPRTPSYLLNLYEKYINFKD